MTRKSQIGMEFLMDYGYGALLLFACTGALMYFGVFHPDDVMPSKCDFGPGLECEGVAFKDDEVFISVKNTMEIPIHVSSVRFMLGNDMESSCNYFGTPITLNPYQTTMINTSERCIVHTKGNKMRIKPEVEFYFSDANNKKTISGNIVT